MRTHVLCLQCSLFQTYLLSCVSICLINFYHRICIFSNALYKITWQFPPSQVPNVLTKIRSENGLGRDGASHIINTSIHYSTHVYSSTIWFQDSKQLKLGSHAMRGAYGASVRSVAPWKAALLSTTVVCSHACDAATPFTKFVEGGRYLKDVRWCRMRLVFPLTNSLKGVTGYTWPQS